MRDLLLASIEPDSCEERALVAGCVLGDRRALDSFGLADQFAACGMAHLVAVSGTHLALLAALVTQVLMAADVRARWRMIVLVGTTGLYVLVCGAPVSAVRAWIMSVSAFGSVAAGRRSHALSAVGVTGLVMALVDPTLCGSVGFMLSLLSVVSLCLYCSYATYVIRTLVPTPRLPRWFTLEPKTVALAYRTVCESFAASLVCQMATLPLVAETFGSVSLVGPFANIVAAPLMAPLMVTGVVGCLLGVVAELRGIALVPTELVARLIIGVTALMEQIPYASISTPSVPSWLMPAWIASMVGLVVAWPRVNRASVCRCLGCVLVASAMLLCRWRYFQPPRIVVLNIGQGDAILVQDGSHAMLVDAGPAGSLLPALQRNHVLHLDAVLVTHLHDDHYGGLDSLVGGTRCERVIVASGVAQAMDEQLLRTCCELTGQGPIEVAYGDTLHVGFFDLEVVWPQQEVDGSENAHSIELLVSYRRGGEGLTALLTGDAERDETGACIAAGDVGDIDLLKVGHHGSEVSLTPQEAAALSPEVAVASAGKDNEYGHPRKECVAMLEGAGAVFLCTKDVGDVTIQPGVEGIHVLCRRGRLD